VGRKAKIKETVEGRQIVELVLTLEVTALTLDEAKEVVKSAQWTLTNKSAAGNFISLKGKKVK
jgi:hypothetical protein